MSQFGQHLSDYLTKSGGDLMGAGLGAVTAAGGDAQKFADSFMSSLPPPPQAPDLSQLPQAAGQSLGLQGPTSSTPGDLIDVARQAASSAGIDPEIFTRQIQQESGFNPNAKSGAGALGIAQFMPGTAQGMGIDPTDPVQALTAAAKLDAQNLQHYGGDWGKALAAYNAGGGNVDKYGGIPPFEETQRYVNTILGGAKDVVQNAASAGQTAVNNAGDALQSAAARTSQFAMGLSSGDAMAFCGPAAAMAFAQTFGRNPTVEEAKQLAASVGWSAGQGMAGPASEVSLLSKLGIDAHMTSGVDWGQVAKDASSGNPVIIDTPGHYFYVQGYNPDTGQFNLGSSATDLKASGGQNWFTPDQIGNLGMGAVRAAIFADHPLSDIPSRAAGSVQSFLSNAAGTASGMSQQAQDTMSAVLDTGLSTAQSMTNASQDWLDQQKSNVSNSFDTAGQLASSLGTDIAGPGGPARNLLTNLGLTQRTPEEQASYDAMQARWDQAQQATEAATGARVEPMGVGDLLGSLLPGAGGSMGFAGMGLGDISPGDVLQQQIDQAIAGGNPLRDVPGVGGASTFLAQQVANPFNLAMLASGAGELKPGQALMETLSDPAVQAALRTRLPAEAEANFALGGIPGALEQLFGEGQIPGSPTAENFGRDVYAAAQQSLLPKTTGSNLLQRAAEQLGQYPEDVQQQVMDLISKQNPADTSELASRILSWTERNPLEGAASGVTDEAQQLLSMVDRTGIPSSITSNIADIAADNGVTITPDMNAGDVIDQLLSKATSKLPGGGEIPGGVMPGQMDLGLAEQNVRQASGQLAMQQGEGGLLDQLISSIGDDQARADAARAAKEARWDDFFQTLIGDRTSDVPQLGMLPGFENAGGSVGPALSNVRGMLPEAGAGETGGLLEDLLSSLSQPASEATQLPRGLSQDMVNAMHTRIDNLTNAAGERVQVPLGTHGDLTSLLRQPGTTPADVARFFANLAGDKPSLADWVRSLRTGSMAGGAGTEGKVALGPLIQTAMRAPTGALNLLMQGRASEIPAGLRGGLSGLAEGAEEALQTIKYGTNWRAVASSDVEGGSGFRPGVSTIGATPFQRALGTVLEGLVRTHGAVGDISAGIGRGANAALGATPEAAAEAGQKWAFRSGEYGAIGSRVARAMQALRSKNPGFDVMSQIIMPFYRVGYNVYTQGVEHSPLGLAGRVIDAAQGKPLDTGKLANNLFGTGLATLAFAEAAQGNITGDHPEGGAPKQSFRNPTGIGPQFLPLRTLGPASEPLAQAAALYESARDNRGDTAGMATQFASEYVKHVEDETWLSNFKDAMDTINAVSNLSSSNTGNVTQAKKDLAYTLGSYGKSFIPQEKLGEQVLGALGAGAQAPPRTGPAPAPKPAAPATRSGPAPASKPAPAPKPAPAAR